MSHTCRSRHFIGVAQLNSLFSHKNGIIIAKRKATSMLDIISKMKNEHSQGFNFLLQKAPPAIFYNDTKKTHNIIPECMILFITFS